MLNGVGSLTVRVLITLIRAGRESLFSWLIMVERYRGVVRRRLWVLRLRIRELVAISGSDIVRLLCRFFVPRGVVR